MLGSGSAADAAGAYSISGTVKSQSTGVGVAETQVIVRKSSNGNQVATALSAFDGSYRTKPSISAGTYNIEFVPPIGSGYQPFNVHEEVVQTNVTLNVELVPGNPASVTVSGVVRDAAGAVLPYARVSFQNSSGNGYAEANNEGIFTTSKMAPGTYNWSVLAERPAGVSPTEFPLEIGFNGSGFEVTSGQYEEIVFPTLHTLTVRTVSSGGSAIPGVKLGTNIGIGLASSISVAAGMQATGTSVVESETTDDEGKAYLAIPNWGGEVDIGVIPPSESGLLATSFKTAGLTEDQTRVVAYPYYETVSSAGPSEGAVEVITPPETVLSSVTAEPNTGAGLPEGAVAVIGSLSYQVDGLTAGESIDVTLKLPPGSDPTKVFKFVDGSFVDVSSHATISGDVVILHLTDGGIGDSDGQANGVVVDPVVPVHIGDQTSGAPEYGRCLKAAKGTKARFKDAGCKTLAKVASEEKFEWYPGFSGEHPIAKAGFTTKIKEGTVAVLEGKSGAKITCTGESSSGTYTGPKTASLLPIKFTGCSSSSGPSCHSEGAAAGEVVTPALTGLLGVYQKGETSATDKIGEDLSPATGEDFAQFECGGTPITVRGHVIVTVTANAMKLTSTDKLAAAKGKQKPEAFLGGPLQILSASFGGPFEQAGEKLTTIRTNEEKVEISSVS
ncbi:MAG TPA: carboxypeptidase-like regulatory domain-containing protein [Solirubrobacteraceae bacterium]|nr:carboxypeptidase-like regulatory domain-containing protein [Solirubrobacteraceae bacterium]